MTLKQQLTYTMAVGYQPAHLNDLLSSPARENVTTKTPG